MSKVQGTPHCGLSARVRRAERIVRGNACPAFGHRCTRRGHRSAMSPPRSPPGPLMGPSRR